MKNNRPKSRASIEGFDRWHRTARISRIRAEVPGPSFGPPSMLQHAHRLGRLLSFQIAIRAQVAYRMCALRLEWGHLGRSQATSPRRLFPVAVLSAVA